jgi:hypothetical protein
VEGTNIAVNDPTIGSVDWTNPTNALAEDGAFAQCTTMMAPVISRLLACSGYDNPIPAKATPTGIKARIKRKCETTVVDNAVRAVKAGGGIGSQDKSAAGYWPTVNTFQEYGDECDLWGELWTAADLNDPTSGLALSASVGALSTAYCDYIERIVYYTFPWTAFVKAEPYGRGTVYVLAWEADSEGNVEYRFDGRAGRPLLHGALHRIETLPSSVNAPDADWDLEVIDRWGNDVLDGLGLNRSATLAEAVFPRILPDTSGHGEKGVGEPLTVKITNAGEGKAGTLRIYTIEL